MEASPICRGQNLTMETVLCFLNAMPKKAMNKSDFNSYAEARLKGWTQTHSQIARQMALYYEDGGICYPRFVSAVSFEEVLTFVKHWAQLYYIPNPYTPSLKGLRPTNIYAFLKKAINEGKANFTETCNTIFEGVSLNNLDKVRVYLTNFTDILVDNDKMSLNSSVLSTNEIVNPNMEILSSKEYFDYFGDNVGCKEIGQHSSCPLQTIFYGAPGTGKSHKIDEQTNDKNSIRATFHPDTDYATFVGAYKPMMDAVDEYALDATGKTHKIDYPNGKSSIIYKYEPQVFLKAYVEAWGKHLNKEDGKDNRYYLVIEEINRGNCAQIFGDLFQLLDREDDGFSSYAISPESAITKYLDEEAKSADGKKFSELDFKDVTKERNGVTKTIATADDLRTGKRLVLPPNLHIWATMNTSDQSLFPIDSAFKRRWDWKYVSISNANKGYKIDINGKQYDWWQFLDRVNTCIGKVTSSEDKKLGYFFCKADKDNNTITADRFVNKVIFYIWGDVLKDYEPSELQFTYDNENLSLMTYKDNGNDIAFNFSSFFKADGEVNCDMARKMLENIGLKPIGKNDDGNLQQDANAEDDADKQANDNA